MAKLLMFLNLITVFVFVPSAYAVGEACPSDGNYCSCTTSGSNDLMCPDWFQSLYGTVIAGDCGTGGNALKYCLGGPAVAGSQQFATDNTTGNCYLKSANITTFGTDTLLFSCNNRQECQDDISDCADLAPRTAPPTSPASAKMGGTVYYYSLWATIFFLAFAV